MRLLLSLECCIHECHYLHTSNHGLDVNAQILKHDIVASCVTNGFIPKSREFEIIHKQMCSINIRRISENSLNYFKYS